MLYCRKCNKRYQDDNKFCLLCGAPLEDVPNIDNKTQEHQQAAQQFDKPMTNANAPGYYEPPKKAESNAGAIIGMFLLSIVPILGFPAAFILAWTKFKSSKFKLAAFTTIFVILNVSVTIFAYAGTINLMKNRLTKAAEKQGTLIAEKQNNSVNTNKNGSNNTSGLPGTNPADIPVNSSDIPVMDENTPDASDIINSGILNSLIPGLSSFDPGSILSDPGALPSGLFDPGTIPSGSSDSEEYSDNVKVHEYDKEGNMIIDIDDDNKDKHGNTLMDLNNDGVYDFICLPDGKVFPYKGSKINDDGSIYLDMNENGIYEMYYDTEDNLYTDYDENGTYDTLTDKSGNIYYDSDGDGKYDQSYGAEYGEG